MKFNYAIYLGVLLVLLAILFIRLLYCGEKGLNFNFPLGGYITVILLWITIDFFYRFHGSKFAIFFDGLKLDFNTWWIFIAFFVPIAYVLYSQNLLCKAYWNYYLNPYYFLLSVVLPLLAPIWEEFIFRGVLINLFSIPLLQIFKKTEKKKSVLHSFVLIIFIVLLLIGITCTSYLFASLHPDKTREGTFFFSCIVSIFYLLTGRNVAPVMTMHFTYNFMSIICV